MTAARPTTESTERLDSIIAEERPNHSTAQELILEVLRKAVLRGAIPPGTKLRQEDLADRFSTSRIPVREALRMLEYEGLVESAPHRGFVVSSLDLQEIEEVYELRMLLEGHALRVLVPLLTDEDIQELRALCDEMADTADADAAVELRERFYLRLYSVSGRPRLVGLIARLRQEVARGLRARLVTDSIDYHRQFLDAIISGNVDLATSYLEGHYRKVTALMRRFVRESDVRTRRRNRCSMDNQL